MLEFLPLFRKIVVKDTVSWRLEEEKHLIKKDNSKKGN